MSSLYLSHYQDESGLGSFFFRSLAAHTLVIILFTGLNFVFGLSQYRLRESNIAIVEGSVRVDVVAMPRLTVKELQSLSALAAQSQGSAPAPVVQAQPKEQERPAPKVADNSKAPVLETQETPKENVMDVLKRTAARKIENQAKPAAEQEAAGNRLSAAEQERLRQLVAAGNRLSEGSSIVGSGQGSELTAFNAYILALPDLVRTHWRLPSFLSEQNLQARIRVYLRANGELIRTEIYESSGNEEYDRRAQEAVRLASPFPNLDADVARRAGRGDIVLGFPL